MIFYDQYMYINYSNSCPYMLIVELIAQVVKTFLEIVDLHELEFELASKRFHVVKSDDIIGVMDHFN